MPTPKPEGDRTGLQPRGRNGHQAGSGGDYEPQGGAGEPKKSFTFDTVYDWK